MRMLRIFFVLYCYILIDMSLTHGLIYNVCIFASFFKVTNGT